MLYCVNELAGTLAAFAIESKSGALLEMQYEALTPKGFGGNARAADLHITADGRFVYAFALDPVGRHLICAGQTDNVVGVYAIDPDGGALTHKHRTAVPANPSWVETLSLQRMS